MVVLLIPITLFANPEGPSVSRVSTIWGRPSNRPGKVWVKGELGFQLAKRKTGLKRKKILVKKSKSQKLNLGKQEHDDLASHFPRKVESSPNKVKDISLGKPRHEKKVLEFADFGSQLKKGRETRPESVKVKRKGQLHVDLPRKKTKTKKLETLKVGLVTNYRVKNTDGSITWGYVNTDGSYKEETIGQDCMTRGKYGYTDPTGKTREYTYTMGIKCEEVR